MIQINIENLETLIHKYKKLINEYTNLSISITNELQTIQENWKSNKIKEMYIKIEEQTTAEKKVIEELKRYIELLKTIEKKYQEIGNDIDDSEISDLTVETKEKIQTIESEIHIDLNKMKERIL